MSVPTVRFRVDFSPNDAVGPGKIALLEHIGSSGSLSQAARELRMSYRRAWQLLESLNGCFGEPVVQSSRGGRDGGGAALTPCGRRLIRVYRAFDKQVQSRAARCFRNLLGRYRRRARRARARRGAARSAPILRLSHR